MFPLRNTGNIILKYYIKIPLCNTGNIILKYCLPVGLNKASTYSRHVLESDFQIKT